MGSTALFGLRFPEDADPVDIAQDIQNLAEDSDSVLNTMLQKTGGTMTGPLVLHAAPSVDLNAATKKYVDDADNLKLDLTGGTLTGDLTIATTKKLSVDRGLVELLVPGNTGKTILTNANTTATRTITFPNQTGTVTLNTNEQDFTISKATPTQIINATSGASSLELRRVAGQNANLAFRTGSSYRWNVQADSTAESGSNAGTNFTIGRYTDAGAWIDNVLTITRSTGAVALTGDLTIDKASPSLVLGGSGSSGTVAAFLRTGSSNRWKIFKDGSTESGSNANSNLNIERFDDSGNSLGTVFQITRSTGLTTLTGDLTINKGDAVFTLGSGSGAGVALIKGAAGNARNVRYATGSTLRWAHGANTTAESGSNAGSDFSIYAYSDAGSLLSTPLTITRSTGRATFSNVVDSQGFVVNTAAGTSAGIQFWTSNLLRWNIRKENTAESGSNVGSDLVINRYDDSGANQGVAFRMARPTGHATFSGAVYASSFGALGGTDIEHRRLSSGAAQVYHKYTLDGTSRMAWMFASDNGLGLRRYDASGTYLSTPFHISNSTGKVYFGDVGATAGLELGTSGPRMMSGTGSPEGAVTAPVGSIWFQTDSTVGVSHWRKASGTGNTGWVVMEGDTGWRNITADLINDWTCGNNLAIRRIGNTVHVRARSLIGTAATAPAFYSVPTGFQGYDVVWFPVGPTATNPNSHGTYYAGELSGGTSSSGYTTWTGARLNASWPTNDAWPTSLPGTAA